VGDVVDLAVTLTRRDPVMRGYSQAEDALSQVGAASHLRIRAVWPASKAIRWRTTVGMPEPKVVRTTDGAELTVDIDDALAPKPPAGAPARYLDVGSLELSQFDTWAAVSALMAPLYAKAETIPADSPLQAEVRRIAAASTDPKRRAEAALRLVQDQVRYAFIGMNLGGYVPADADLTWRRRFGDCKGKTVLLLALLQQLGVSAQPVLVSSGGDGMDERLPMLAFDHVIARAQIGGKGYWLDGTRSGDRDLDDIKVPGFRWALPVQNADAALVRLTQAPLEQPGFESLMRLDASGGLAAKAPAHLEHLFRGDAAVGWNLLLTATGHADADRALRAYWRDRLPWIEPKTVDFSYDEAQRVIRLTMDGLATMEWQNDGAARNFQIVDSNLGFEPSFTREASPHVDAPFAVAFPRFDQWTVIIALPQGGAGAGLLDAGDVDQTIAGVRYQRRTRIAGGVVTMTASERSLAPEFPAAEAEAAAAKLRQLTAFDVTVRDEPTVAATARAPMQDLGPAPVDAAGFAARGAGRLEAEDYGRAIADFDQAIKLSPASAKYVYDRGVAHFRAQQDDLAMADFNRALQLDPADAFALDARAQLHLARKEFRQAKADFDAASKAAPDDIRRLEREAKIYDGAARFDDEIAVLGVLIARGPSAEYFNYRCWARAEAGQDLDAAMKDCDAALKLQPDYRAAFDSRALAEVRLGRFDEAIRDYDSAAQRGGAAASLYGRGIAEARKGQKQKADADMARARELDKDVETTFARLGVTP
jgi:tetratricopeptide (TPR) repeat protein